MEALLLEQIIGSQGPLSGEKVKTVTAINGGCIHDAWQIQLRNGERFFAKIASIDNFDLLKFEAYGLNELNKHANRSFISIPTPLFVQELETHFSHLRIEMNENVLNEEKKDDSDRRNVNE